MKMDQLKIKENKEHFTKALYEKLNGYKESR
ncbi:MAG: hypothetical protein CM15mV18_0640 [uncultured marine virus]|nr:MAG: hypothetical protein CM15mV18_0640 [uncultured marine virus]